MNALPISHLIFNCRRSICTTGKLCAKARADVAVGGAKSSFKSKAGIVPEPEPVRDTKLLVSRCCGLSKFKDQEDPVLKSDDEYPDWLWSIHVGKPRPYYELDPSTKLYWKHLYRYKRFQSNIAKKGIRFYQPPKEHEITFMSRLPLKTPGENVK